jgi:hypothetical protein
MIVNGTEITEFHNIMPINNISSVLRFGILSHNRAANIQHESIASPFVQERRNKKIPNGSFLHDYANLYFHARNPMMFSIKSRSEICVLRVSENVLNMPKTILSDRNAASDYARYYSTTEISQLDFDLIYSKDWRCPNNPTEYFRRKTAKCAEVLVMDKIPIYLIMGAYVKNDIVQKKLEKQGFNRKILINEDLFFG